MVWIKLFDGNRTRELKLEMAKLGPARGPKRAGPGLKIQAHGPKRA